MTTQFTGLLAARQHGSTVSPGVAGGPGGSTRPSAQAAATAIAARALLNCYLRESDVATLDLSGDQPQAHIPVGVGGHVHVALTYYSPTGRHQFGEPRLVTPDCTQGRPVSLALLASMLIDTLSARSGTEFSDDLLARIINSRQNIAWYLRARDTEVDDLWSASPLPFSRSEQALLVGHQLHPNAKSRLELSAADQLRYSPELGSAFPLHWLAVRPEYVRQDSAEPQSAAELVATLAHTGLGAGPGALEDLLVRARGRVLIPAHPWQAKYLENDPQARRLIESGVVTDLGPFAGAVQATTSVRTVYRSAWLWQLKFSLSAQITNSVRVTLTRELDRAVEAARLHHSEWGQRAARLVPRVRFVHDPAYLAVTCSPGGPVVEGFSVIVRENPWNGRTGEDVAAVATLCQDHPFGGHSRLGAIVRTLARASGQDIATVGREWFRRFCEVTVRSLIRLYLDSGLCFEAHQQNTLLELSGGWPVRMACRDSQGYFHRAAAHDDICAILPGHGEITESIFPEDLADQRLAYYMFTNLTLGVVNALGTAGCADERVLLRDLRGVLESERSAGGRYPATLLDGLLDKPTWPCKANLLTRMGEMDELVGDIADQSVYVTIPNPLCSP